jgi:uncharacterized protein YjiS (DUF1127 family)
MSAPIAKQDLAFTLGNLTYVDSTYDDGIPQTAAPAPHGFSAWVNNFAAKLADWQRRRAVMEEMAMMTDRELSDIGLSRADLPRVFDPSFAFDHVRGRDYVAY